MDAISWVKVISPDGTPIACNRNGTGAPLILVPGAGAANPVAWPVIQALREHFTVYTVDRRGHGESGDSPIYTIVREFEDITAIMDSLGEPVNLLGHSYGGLCALEAAILTHNIRKLVLYEPLSLLQPSELVYLERFVNHLQAMLDAGDLELVLTTHYRENAGMSQLEIEQMKTSPAWPERLISAHTLVRELREEASYTFDAQRFKNLHVPTLLLRGGDSRDCDIKGTQAVASALPNSRIAVMPGQGHIAMYTAPELFASIVLKFLEE